MNYITGIDRNQPSFWSLEEMIGTESMVRVIDRFVEVINLDTLGFTRTKSAVTGRPGYAAEPLAKLYLYGYENGIRSSRKLEEETQRNIEVMWLMEGLKPDHSSISEFRRKNVKAMKRLFREFVKLCRAWELSDGKVIAQDGTKISASNGSHNHYKKATIEKRIRRIDEKIEAYLAKMEEADRRKYEKEIESKTNDDTNGKTNGNTNDDTNGKTNGNTNDDTNGKTNGNINDDTNGKTNGNTNDDTNGKTNDDTNDDTNETPLATPKELLALLSHKERYESYKKQMEIMCAEEISTVDVDARQMGSHSKGFDMRYNMQIAVDGKHHIIVESDVSNNPTDRGEMGNMAKRLKKRRLILPKKQTTYLADKGYYSGSDLAKMKKMGIKTIVPRQAGTDPKEQPKQFHTASFQFNADTDTYRCPMGHILTRSANRKRNLSKRIYSNKSACKQCVNQVECIRGKAPYRSLVRRKYANIYDSTDRIYAQNTEVYKLRKQLVEHPFGTIKRNMNGGYFLLRTLPKVRAEAALFALAYNIKRAFNVLGFKEIMARLNACSSSFSFYFLLSYFMPVSKISFLPLLVVG